MQLLSSLKAFQKEQDVLEKIVNNISKYEQHTENKPRRVGGSPIKQFTNLTQFLQTDKTLVGRKLFKIKIHHVVNTSRGHLQRPCDTTVSIVFDGDSYCNLMNVFTYYWRYENISNLDDLRLVKNDLCGLTRAYLVITFTDCQVSQRIEHGNQKIIRQSNQENVRASALLEKQEIVLGNKPC